MTLLTNYFIQAILPDMPYGPCLKNFASPSMSTPTKSKNETISENENAQNTQHVIEEIKVQPSHELNLDKNKPILVILDSYQEQGISEQSKLLMDKILLSMQLKNSDFQYLTALDKHQNQDALCASISNSKTRVIFLIGTLTMQHFLGKDKKISQTQGQIFDYSYQDCIYYFIPLYHPDFIALNSSIKNLTWNSVKNLIPWLKQHLT